MPFCSEPAADPLKSGIEEFSQQGHQPFRQEYLPSLQTIDSFNYKL